MQNKGINDTLLNDAGVIIQDTFIKIKSIMINNRKLRYAVSDLGNVYYNDGTQHLKNNYLAKNGYYELQFTLPIRTFLQQYYSTWNTYKPVDVASEIKVIDNFLKTL